MSNTLYWMVTIIDRNQSRKFLSFYRNYGISVVLSTLGHGTAASNVLNYFSLEATQKAVLCAVVTDTVWNAVKKGLETIMQIDIPGTGVAFVVPVSSVGGKRQLQFITSGMPFTKGEESVLKDTKYELLVVVANQGYTETIMEAARRGKAAGGTMIHAKGTGSKETGKFLSVSIAEEKDMVYIVAKAGEKAAIMRSINEKAGPGTKAGAICFSLPISSVVGLRESE